ncbi:MAG: hypothetical protein IT445_00185 [Phycisphaeraceae bacterium]|nr:hypothetical protein [Phycisphaeraceae bacterium]
MDPDHKHELKENDLEQFLANFGQWRKKYGASTLLWVMLIVLALVGYNLYASIRSTSHDNAWGDLAATSTPAGFMRVAEEHGNKAVTMLALLRGGDAALSTVLSPPTGDEKFNAEDALNQAENAYQQVVQTADSPLFKINGLLGLAAVTECRSQWDEAAKLYDQAIELAKNGYPDLGQRAEHRKSMLGRLSEPIVFAPPAPVAATTQVEAPPATPQVTAPEAAAPEAPSEAAEQTPPATSP